MLRPTIYRLTCLAVAGATLGAGSQYDGTYIGTEALTSGTGPTCLPGGGVTITISGHSLELVDSQSHRFALRFEPQPNGSFATAYSGIADGVVDVRGSIADNVIEADTTNYGNGCAHHVHAEKSHPG